MPTEKMSPNFREDLIEAENRIDELTKLVNSLRIRGDRDLDLIRKQATTIERLRSALKAGPSNPASSIDLH